MIITSCEKWSLNLNNNDINAIKLLVVNKFIKKRINVKRKIKDKDKVFSRLLLFFNHNSILLFKILNLAEVRLNIMI